MNFGCVIAEFIRQSNNTKHEESYLVSCLDQGSIPCRNNAFSPRSIYSKAEKGKRYGMKQYFQTFKVGLLKELLRLYGFLSLCLHITNYLQARCLQITSSVNKRQTIKMIK